MVPEFFSIGYTIHCNPQFPWRVIVHCNTKISEIITFLILVSFNSEYVSIPNLSSLVLSVERNLSVDNLYTTTVFLDYLKTTECLNT